MLVALSVIVAVFVPVASAQMIVTLKDGRVFQVPVRADEIASIVFSGPVPSQGAFVPSAPAFTLPIAKPALWLDASDASTLYPTMKKEGGNSVINGPVGLWLDKSGSGRNFVKPQAAEAPLLVQNGIGNLPAIQFAPSSALFTDFNFTVPVTVIHVAKMRKGTASRVLSATKNNWLSGYWMGYMHTAYHGGWVTVVNIPADTAAHVFTSVIRGAGADSSAYGDGKLIASNQAGVEGPNGLSVNANPYGENSDCVVGEILVYPRALTESERLAVEDYLAAKWKVAR